MPIDVRLPISGLFLAVGLILVVYGVFAEGVGSVAGDLNTIWGGVMLAFGLILGYYGARAERRARVMSTGGAQVASATISEGDQSI
jgi:hypothetical protein